MSRLQTFATIVMAGATLWMAAQHVLLKIELEEEREKVALCKLFQEYKEDLYPQEPSIADLQKDILQLRTDMQNMRLGIRGVVTSCAKGP